MRRQVLATACLLGLCVAPLCCAQGDGSQQKQADSPGNTLDFLVEHFDEMLGFNGFVHRVKVDTQWSAASFRRPSVSCSKAQVLLRPGDKARSYLGVLLPGANLSLSSDLSVVLNWFIPATRKPTVGVYEGRSLYVDRGLLEHSRDLLDLLQLGALLVGDRVWPLHCCERLSSMKLKQTCTKTMLDGTRVSLALEASITGGDVVWMPDGTYIPYAGWGQPFRGVKLSALKLTWKRPGQKGQQYVDHGRASLHFHSAGPLVLDVPADAVGAGPDGALRLALKVSAEGEVTDLLPLQGL